jgi:hypothetical protein
MIIKCSTMGQFLDVIWGLTVRGMTFEADADTFTIKTLGGF